MARYEAQRNCHPHELIGIGARAIDVRPECLQALVRCGSSWRLGEDVADVDIHERLQVPVVTRVGSSPLVVLPLLVRKFPEVFACEKSAGRLEFVKEDPPGLDLTGVVRMRALQGLRDGLVCRPP